MEDKKLADPSWPRPSDEKLSALKQYRQAKGLCFKCGEKCNPQHKCPAIVSLHAMEQLWQCISEDGELKVQSSSNCGF